METGWHLHVVLSKICCKKKEIDFNVPLAGSEALLLICGVCRILEWAVQGCISKSPWPEILRIDRGLGKKSKLVGKGCLSLL